MKKFYIPPSYYSPLIDFNANGYLLIKGRAVSEIKLREFYQLTNWIRNIKCNDVYLSIGLDYIGNHSLRQLKCLFELIDSNNAIAKKSVIWFIHSQDQDLKDTGLFFAEMFPGFLFDFQYTLREEPIHI